MAYESLNGALVARLQVPTQGHRHGPVAEPAKAFPGRGACPVAVALPFPLAGCFIRRSTRARRASSMRSWDAGATYRPGATSHAFAARGRQQHLSGSVPANVLGRTSMTIARTSAIAAAAGIGLFCTACAFAQNTG